MNKYQEMDFNLSQRIQFHTVSSWYHESKLLYLTNDARVPLLSLSYQQCPLSLQARRVTLCSLTLVWGRILFLVRSDSGLKFYRSKNAEQKNLGFNGKQRGML